MIKKIENGLCWAVAAMLTVGLLCVILLQGSWEQGEKLVKKIDE